MEHQLSSSPRYRQDDRPHIVWLGLSQYELCLEHCLLNALGELSHFLLDVLSQRHALDGASLQQITGFQPSQLAPIYQRLQGLKLLNSEQILTAEGERLARILRDYHGKRWVVCLDHHYDRHYHQLPRLCFHPDEPYLAPPPADAIMVPLPKGARNSDAAQQLKSLEYHFSTLMPKMIPGIEQVLLPDERGASREWQITLNRLPQPVAMPVSLWLKPWSLSAATAEPHLTLLTPALQMAMHFHHPQGLESDDPLPAALTASWSAYEEKIQLPSPWSFPQKEGVSLCGGPGLNAAEAAVRLQQHLNQALPAQSWRYSMQQIFTPCWQPHHYRYEEIIDAATAQGKADENH